MIRNVPTCFCRLALATGLTLLLSACAGSGGLFSPRAHVPADSGVGVPEHVRNLPKSRTGNMAQYTVFGKQYRVMDSAANFTEQGVASWYGKKFHGRKTSSGEVYDMYAMTAAHKHLPLPTFVRVTNLENNRSVVVKVNDRGPFIGDRIIDMSYTAAERLGMLEKGTVNVRVDALSTHIVDENADASNLNVAQAFSKSEPQPAPLAPVVVEPEIAAVPLSLPVQAIQLVESDTPAAEPLDVAATNISEQDDAEPVIVDGTEDGFVELVDTAVLSQAEPMQEPTDVSPLMVDSRPVSARPAVKKGQYYIQLGAFSLAPNAQAYVESVAEQTGLPSFVEQDRSKGLFRVKMGPFQQGELLDRTVSELAGVGIDSYTKQAVQN